MKKISFEEAIELLEQGKKVYTKGNRYAAYYCDTPCLYDRITGEMKEYNAKLLSFEDYEIPEEPKPFEITETGLYKTRDGRMAMINEYTDEFEYEGVVLGQGGLNFWKKNGKVYSGQAEASDIIGKVGGEDKYLKNA